MKSYTTGRNLTGSLTKNTSSANLTLMDQIANDDYRALCAMRDWPWLERLRTDLTEAGVQAYPLPYDCDQIREIAFIISSKRYVPRISPSQQHWDRLNAVSSNSDIPEWCRVFDGNLQVWPTPVTAGNTINITQKTRVIDLNVADYTTGTIVSVASGGTAVVGSGTSWTAQMQGRWIRMTNSDTANTGDGLWYEIASVTDATHLTLTRTYGGTAISAGSATYTIGQMPLLPEAFHDMPWIWAAGTYWQKENDDRGEKLLGQHGIIGSGSTISTGRVKLLETTWSNPTTNMVINDGGSNEEINPNLTISY